VAVDTRTGHAVVLDYAGDESNASDTSNGTISVVDTRSGRLLWHIHAQGRPYAVVVDEHSGRAFVRSDGPAGTRLVNVIDMSSGRLIRTVTVAHSRGAISGTIVVDERRGRVFVLTPRGGLMGLGSVSVLDAASGRLLRTVGVGTFPENAVVAERAGRIFVADTGSGTVSVLDAVSGRLVHTALAGQHPRLMLVDERAGRVFVADNVSGTVTVLDAHSGAVLRSVAVGVHMSAMAADARSGRIFISSVGSTDAAGYLTGPGSVSVLDASSGRLLRTVPVGWDPTHVVVDEQAGRALVLNAGGSSAPDAFGWVPSCVPGIQHPARPCNNAPQPGTGVAPTCRLVPGSVTVLDAAR